LARRSAPDRPPVSCDSRSNRQVSERLGKGFGARERSSSRPAIQAPAALQIAKSAQSPQRPHLPCDERYRLTPIAASTTPQSDPSVSAQEYFVEKSITPHLRQHLPPASLLSFLPAQCSASHAPGSTHALNTRATAVPHRPALPLTIPPPAQDCPRQHRIPRCDSCTLEPDRRRLGVKLERILPRLAQCRVIAHQRPVADCTASFCCSSPCTRSYPCAMQLE